MQRFEREAQVPASLNHPNTTSNAWIRDVSRPFLSMRSFADFDASKPRRRKPARAIRDELLEVSKNVAQP